MSLVSEKIVWMLEIIELNIQLISDDCRFSDCLKVCLIKFYYHKQSLLCL